MGALKQYYLYWRIERRGASKSWCRAGKERAMAQIRWTLCDLLEFVGAMLCALVVAVALYIIAGGM